tara:strand:- start:222 stop:536 length:315 start_codon:yes stop_codon:yes gene_type:complete
MSHATPNATQRQNDIAAEQALRSQALFAAVVMTAIDDAITENLDRKDSSGTRDLESWAQSDDGQEILSLAGIDPSKRAVDKMAHFVDLGIKTTVSEMLRKGVKK